MSAFVVWMCDVLNVVCVRRTLKLPGIIEVGNLEGPRRGSHLLSIYGVEQKTQPFPPLLLLIVHFSFRSSRAQFKMTPPLTPSSSILIIGAGTWGCSTALHLARRGYENVKVLDPYAVPSPIAAGNDVNKIMEHKQLKGRISWQHIISKLSS